MRKEDCSTPTDEINSSLSIKVSSNDRGLEEGREYYKGPFYYWHVVSITQIIMIW